jgi:pimeloyl-ACP methyl ester carboxylesterase
VAPDLRGYGRSDRPEVEKYTVLHDIGDIVGLVDALDAQQAVIAGHDIGATVAWQAALLRPDRFRGVIALGPPFRPRASGSGSAPPTTLMPRNEDAVFYQLYFQTPEAEAALGRDIRRLFRSQFYSLSGDRPPSAGGGFPAGMVPRKGALLTDPASLPPWITETDIDVYVAEFTRSGFRGPLAWWRNIDRSWELLAPLAGATVTVPALYIAGDRDFVAAVFSPFIAKQSAMVPKLRPAIMLPGCGHWTQQERAPEVSAAMIDFLRSL